MHILLLFLFGFFIWCTPSTAQANEYDYFVFPEDNLYMKIYEKIGDIEEDALQNTSLLLGASPERLQRIISGKPQGNDLSIVCGTGQQWVSHIYNCEQRIQKVYNTEVEMLDLEQRLYFESLSESAWANGTLEDGSFDVLVDLNTIDVLYFGKNANISGGPSPFLFDGNTNTDGKNNADDNNNDDGDNTGNNNDSGDDNNNSGNNDNTTGNQQYPQCIDPDSLTLTTFTGTGNIFNTGGNEKNISYEQQRQRLLGNIAGRGRTLNTAQYPDGTEKQCDGQQVSLYGNRVCIDLRCDDIICIHITFVPGYRNVEIQDTDCIECSIHRGLEVLQLLEVQGGQLSTNDSPTEPWFLTAFATMFREAGGKFEWIWRPLPFLVYDNPPEEHEKKKEVTTTDTKETTEKSEPSKAERIAELKAINTALFGVTKNHEDTCASLTKTLTVSDINTETFLHFCAEDFQKREQYFETNISGNIDITGRSQATEQVKKNLYTAFFKDVIQTHLTNMSSEAVAINTVFNAIHVEAIQESQERCTTKSGS